MTLEDRMNRDSVPSGPVPCIVQRHSRGVMSSVGFSAAKIEVNLPNDSPLIERVCMAILEPHQTPGIDNLAVLAFFKNSNRGEIMMADGSPLPFCAGLADLTVVRMVRKMIANLTKDTGSLREQIYEDVRAASGRSKPGSRSGSANSSPVRRSGSSSPVETKKAETNLNVEQLRQALYDNSTSLKENSFSFKSQMQRTNEFSRNIHENLKFHGMPESRKFQVPGQLQVPERLVGGSRAAYAPREQPKHEKPIQYRQALQSSSLSKQHGSSKSTGNRRQPPPNQFKCSVFVSHIASGATWHDLQSAFSSQVAPTLRVYMKPGCSWAHVYFYDLNGVEKAIEAAAAGLIKVCGRPVRVRRRTRKKKVKRNHSSSVSPIGTPQEGPKGIRIQQLPKKEFVSCPSAPIGIRKESKSPEWRSNGIVQENGDVLIPPSNHVRQFRAFAPESPSLFGNGLSLRFKHLNLGWQNSASGANTGGNQLQGTILDSLKHGVF
eukprot:CAMPEP_0114515076 /NCGR_PEP_ID=MMETSP0109-20121206/16518_1 /TAXON_ID=29199 /ORGANISM="Chlorarachnion reptans, Strain CCCM449" /LENGTH=490 /DNA_ID=CAMNT_0001695207 /DNA_START=299 /DNA_END=1771 /DNA_ORIENTATION=-